MGLLRSLQRAWLDRQQARRNARADAERLIRDHGDGAYGIARACRGKARATGDAKQLHHWARVTSLVAIRTGYSAGLKAADRYYLDHPSTARRER